MTLPPPPTEGPAPPAPVAYPPVSHDSRGAVSVGRLAAWGMPVGVVLVVAALGVPLGLLWSAVTPRTQWLKVDNGAPVYADPNSERLLAGDGWFLLLGLGAGILVAAVAWALLRRYRGPVIMVALVLGSLVAAWLAWQTGHRIGLEAYRQWRENGAIGSQRGSPVSLRVTDMAVGSWWPPKLDGVLAAQALAAAFVYTCCAGWSRFPSLRGPDPFSDEYPEGHEPQAVHSPQAPYDPEAQFGPGRTESSERGTGTALT